MKHKILFGGARRLMTSVLILVLMAALTIPVGATQQKVPFEEILASYKDATFTYELFLTDQNGLSVTNPRSLSAGDTVYVEIRLTRLNYNDPTYNSFGIEFRLLTRGLTYNNDGATLRSGTKVHRATYMEGDSVGFAWYDLQQKGEAFANPVLAASWSYTVTDPNAVNITVPVALIYVTGDKAEHVPVGKATLYLDLNGGELVGKDVSGEYVSGTKVTLPDAKNGEYVFAGWSDGVYLYPAGSRYAVSGIVTLTAQWEGLVRDRYVTFLPEGGTFTDKDLSGHYADGEVIILPEAIRDGFKLVGWTDGVNTYKPGDEYVVDNTVNLIAVWEEVAVDDEGGVAGDVVKTMLLVGGIAAGSAGLGLLILLLLWKRRLVKYSLVNGDVKLYYNNGEKPVQVDVVLYDGAMEYHLSRSGIVQAKHRLRLIKNATMNIADIEEGTYKGKLRIYDGRNVEVKKCRIKVVNEELDD